MKIPIDAVIIESLSRLVDDAQSERRDPSHADIGFQIAKAGLESFDPNKQGNHHVGKAKRIRTILFSALESNQDMAEKFASGLLSSIKACGGFNKSSLNFVGEEPINNLRIAFKPHGFILDNDGNISNTIFDNLSTQGFTEALNNYVLRAKKGIEDAALTVGTSKDLIEAIAAHVITEIYGQYSTTSNFPTLLAQAFVGLKLSTSADKPIVNESPTKQMERNIFDLAISINKLRNKEGTGHGRPWLPKVTNDEAKFAIEAIGIIGEFLLKKLEGIKGK